MSVDDAASPAKKVNEGERRVTRSIRDVEYVVGCPLILSRVLTRTYCTCTYSERQSIGVRVELEWNPMPCPEIDSDKWVDHFHS